MAKVAFNKNKRAILKQYESGMSVVLHDTTTLYTKDITKMSSVVIICICRHYITAKFCNDPIMAEWRRIDSLLSPQHGTQTDCEKHT